MPEGLPAYPGANSGAGERDGLAASSEPTHSVGERIGGRYQLDRQLGRGELTETWAATQIDLGRAVAIKFLRRRDSGDRMLHEARAIARVRHPHVVEFSDVGRTGAGQPYFVMELLAGQTLAGLLAERGRLAWARAVAVGQQVADALTAAHRQQIVHRELRPGNVFLVDGGRSGDFVKLVDFGLARAGDAAATPARAAPYMSPEQCAGGVLDARSDVYALGCLLFAMVTGEPPFVGEPHEVVARHQHEAPPSLRKRAPRQLIPDELEAIVARCLAKAPGERYSDTTELAGELGRIAKFAAAASIAGAPTVGVSGDAGASGSRPMNYAGRPAGDPRLRTASHPTVAEPPSDPRSGRAFKTVATIVAGIIVVGAFGVGMFFLVRQLIGESGSDASVAGEAAPSDAERKVAPSEAAPEPVEPPALGGMGGGPGPGGAAPAASAPADASPAVEGGVDGEPGLAEADAEVNDPKLEPIKARKRGRRGASVDEGSGSAKPEPAPQPKPDAEPTPSEADAVQPEPEPPPPKPTPKPDSKAKGGITHEDLLDPWG